MITLTTTRYQPKNPGRPAYNIFGGFQTPGPNGETWVVEYDTAVPGATSLHQLPASIVSGGPQATPTTVRLVCTAAEVQELVTAGTITLTDDQLASLATP